MKKKNTAIIGVSVVVLVLLGFSIKKYYDDRYVGTTYYAVVRSADIIEPEEMYGDNGGYVAKGHEYALRAYNDKGEWRVAEFSMQAESADDLYQDGTYLKIEHSKTIVVKQAVVDQSEVPVEILTQLEKDTGENK